MRKMHTQAGIGEHLGDRFREGLVVAGRDEQPGLAVFDERLQAAHTRTHDRRAAGHRLERDEAE